MIRAGPILVRLWANSHRGSRYRPAILRPQSVSFNVAKLYVYAAPSSHILHSADGL
jgi:hypothetical protein